MKTLLTFLSLAAASALAQVSIGIQIGAPPPPQVVRVLPPQPGPDFTWVAGYWYPVGNHYKWHAGYWTRPAYVGSHWVPPRYEAGRYYNGFWDGNAGRREHDHRWDREQGRDFRGHDNGKRWGRGHGQDRQ